MGIVYSSEKGRMCPTCGWPANNCQCSTKHADRARTSGAAGAVPARVVAKLRMEKKGRGGKVVSVVYDLPDNDAFLKELCQELKRACGTGGAVTEAGIEIQGDQRDRLRALLAKKGYVVKG